MKTVFYNGRILNGEVFSEGLFVEVENDRINRVGTGMPGGDELVDLQGGYLVPAFIDIQLYGGNQQLFGEHPSVEALTATYEYSLAGGATHILPTVATNSTEVMHAAIEAVREYWQQQLPGVAGLHLEGPYINPARRGAHITEFIKSPSLHEVEQLMNAGRGIIKMMTLAPEMCSPEVISYLQKSGVIISAGHTDANFAQATHAFSNGIHLATHLFNAMSPLQHRAPGMAGAILHTPDVCASIIADGHHVDFAVIGIAKKIMQERLFLITDAVTENTSGLYQHRLQGDKYVVADGTLSGSSLTMLKAVHNCIDKVGISLEESLRMASLYPARALKMDNVCGRIAEGYSADLLWLNNELQLRAVYTNGSLMHIGL
ncbi:MAG: N-acetylglucosamine-6-phosphate deacetylase [Chitinophagaceae bacterium]